MGKFNYKFEWDKEDNGLWRWKVQVRGEDVIYCEIIRNGKTFTVYILGPRFSESKDNLLTLVKAKAYAEKHIVRMIKRQIDVGKSLETLFMDDAWITM